MIKATKNHQKWFKIISPCDMSQQSVLTAFLAIATPEQMLQNKKQEWATLCNDKKAQQAFNKVSTSMHAEKTAENQHKNDAK